jgi:two-component system, NarL family, sensor histidine kinase DevS
MTSDNADRKEFVAPGAIEEELAEVSRLTARPLDEDKTAQYVTEVAQRIADGLRRLLGRAECEIYAVEGAAAPGLQPLAASPIRENTEPVRAHDPADQAARERRTVNGLDGGELVIAVPLLGRDRPVGVLEVRRVHGLWTRDETRLIQIFADHAAIALESARLVTESRQRRRTAEALALLAHATSRSFDVSTLGREIVDTLLPLLRCARATLFELNEGAYRLVAVARADGVQAADDLAGPELGPVEARALRERRLVATLDFLTDPKLSTSGHGREAPIRAVLAIPLFHEDTPIGVLSIGDRAWRSFGREEIEVFRAAADHAAVALEHARLHAQVAEGVRVRERVRIANELHDTLSQLAFSVGLKLDWCLHRTPPTSPVYPKLEEIHYDVGLMMAQIRQLMGHLSPEGLAEMTFANRLERLVRDFRELTGTAVDLSLRGDLDRLTPVAADVLQKTLQEALVNIAKHARAGRADVRIEIDGNQTSIEIADDGVGLSVGATEVIARPGHVGLRRMRERIEACGGRLEIVGRTGAGVTIRGSFPLRPEGA